MTKAQGILRWTLPACALGLSLPLLADDDLPAVRPTVVVSVKATGNGPLHYRWKSSDGRIHDVDAPSTKWTLPSGPGLHFAYVLVSDREGGYAEGRIAVNTDDLGGVPESLLADPRPLVPPPAPAQQGDYYRGFVDLGFNGNEDVLSAGVGVFLTDKTTGVRYPPAGSVVSGPDGAFTVAGVPAGSSFSATCSLNNGARIVPCGDDAMLSTAFTQYDAYLHSIDAALFDSNDPAKSAYVAGNVTLKDFTPCGTNNELFDVHAAATATLLDANGTALVSTQADEFGDWSILTKDYPTATQVRYRCEGAAPKTMPVTLPAPPFFIGVAVPAVQLAGTGVPVISAMTAPLNGNPGLFLPEPSKVLPAVPAGGLPTRGTDWTAFPSDYVPRSDDFLSFKGLDTRRGACQYYKAIGAVHACRTDGRLVGPISYEDWQRAVKIGAYATHDGVKAAAAYVNKVDLNLTRVHESVRYGTDSLAAVVCNHLGPDIKVPADVLNPLQGSIDAAVDHAVKGKNLVACVAMDYALHSGVNGNQKFVRFYIFGPSGELLPSINLDGRGEKFVPGSCVPCHGGDHYAGRYPQDGTGYANFGGHFLPYDSGNFEFSMASGLTGADQEEGIYQLNQNLLNVDPASAGPGALTQAGRDLITGWYSRPMFPHALDPNFIPKSWQDAISTKPADAIVDFAVAPDFYKRVLARACRTCHVNQIAPYNFDDFRNVSGDAGGTVMVGQTQIMLFSAWEFHRSTCGNGSDSHLFRRLTMPNSQVTFNRYWLSQGTQDQATGDSTDQPQLQLDFFKPSFKTANGYSYPCSNPPALTP
jgi:hypothetical protein